MRLAAKFVLERFWLGYSTKWFALDVADQANDSDCLSPIPFGPPHQVLGCGRIELNASQSPSFAAASSREIPSRRCKEARRRSFMAFDFSK
jgi:hypothetical protein